MCKGTPWANPRRWAQHRAQYNQRPYGPHPHIRTKQDLIKGYPELVWALFWVAGVIGRVRVVLGFTKKAKSLNLQALQQLLRSHSRTPSRHITCAPKYRHPFSFNVLSSKKHQTQ